MPLELNHHYLTPELCREVLDFFGFVEEAHSAGLVRFRRVADGRLVEIDLGMGRVHEEDFCDALAAGGVEGDAVTTEIDARRGPPVVP